MFDFIPNWVKHPIDAWNNWHPVDDAINSAENYIADKAKKIVNDVIPGAAGGDSGTASTGSKTTVGTDGTVETVNADGTTKPKEKPGIVDRIITGVENKLGIDTSGSDTDADGKPKEKSGILGMLGGLFSNGISGFIEGIFKIAAAVIMMLVKPIMDKISGHHDGATADAGASTSSGGGGVQKPEAEKPGVVATVSNWVSNATDFVVDKFHAAEESFGGTPHPSRRVLRFAEKYDVAGIEDRHHLAHGTLLAIMDNESRGVEGRVSKEGAQGLMQFMPKTAARFGIDPNDPKQALEGAATYMEALSKEFHGDQRAMFAAYNAGEGRIEHYTAGTASLPEETKNYVGRAMKLMQPYGEATVAIANAKVHGGAAEATMVADAQAAPKPSVGESAAKAQAASVGQALHRSDVTVASNTAAPSQQFTPPPDGGIPAKPVAAVG